MAVNKESLEKCVLKKLESASHALNFIEDGLFVFLLLCKKDGFYEENEYILEKINELCGEFDNLFASIIDIMDESEG